MSNLYLREVDGAFTKIVLIPAVVDDVFVGDRLVADFTVVDGKPFSSVESVLVRVVEAYHDGYAVERITREEQINDIIDGE